MDLDLIPANPYLLLTPGPLSTTKSVRAAMLRDWCTWDDDYNQMVETVRSRLVALASPQPGYSCVLMQGSGTFSVEATISSAIPVGGKLLVLNNGAYGDRIVKIAQYHKIAVLAQDSGELGAPDLQRLRQNLEQDSAITHVAVVHCETTTGMLNPIYEIGAIVKEFKKTFIIDAMSSFGGIPIDMDEVQADFLISSANKCIQGVPGFGFILAKREALETCRGRARSLSLDLYDQWQAMDKGKGKWRFTSPTHVVRAFSQALDELQQEGLVERFNRYRNNQRLLVNGMRELGFETLLPDAQQSPIITSFISPKDPDYSFQNFYTALKKRGFVIYPGKVTVAATFRIGNIGDVHAADMTRLLTAIELLC
ncbi:2-aminoethylphosphonate-pyruvate transaminase [Desulfuromusa kysingii]|uniref:2-aminoethylphosphonate--pyruvate transaminase n=1 Tax=Desulfuromusa kysingii TaxID=37625 RepID=A0A1H4DJE9_9BACT|nr:2-aminoethylphosphonate--pyruvate transaminase [Desulfuromusa kysingii]SEA72911.1 2-aminoethylphosphonate-pyruvate transaminase [Desulfuromusa kysingii]